MASFIQIDYPTEHPGVARMERAAGSLRGLAQRANPGASLLLAAVVASLLVVANQVVDTWTEGHLLAAWIVMWLVAFAALALLAAPARRASRQLAGAVRRWRAARHAAAEERRLWDAALTDARIMADLSRAMTRESLRDPRYY